MNRGLFATQLNEAERLLNELSLLRERFHHPPYESLTAANFRSLTYINIWEKCYNEKIYDFLLIDYSIIQLRGVNFNPLEVSYSFHECPYLYKISIEQFIEQRLALDDEINELDLIRDYEMLWDELKENVTPIRYDFAPSKYTEGRHPASHVHFGHKNEIRVGTKRVLKPLSFVLFIIRQNYPDKWQILTHLRNAEILCRNVSQNIELVNNNYCRPLDTWEMTLS